MRRFAAVLVLALVAVAGPAPAGADEGGGVRGAANNIVQVVNQVDGATRARSGVAVSRNATDTVGNQNLALARASCTGCRTVAAAVQVVVVEGNPTTFAPENAGVAINENCTNCRTFAYANQVVLSPHHPVHIGDGARDRMEAVYEQIDGAVRSGQSFPELSATLDRLTAQLVAIVQAEIDRSGARGDRQDRRDVHQDEA